MSRFSDAIDHIQMTIESRRHGSPSASWTAKLLADPELAAKKLEEEASELAQAARLSEKSDVTSESADLIYHWLVLLAAQGVDLDAVAQKLEARQKQSGVSEKASRSNVTSSANERSLAREGSLIEVLEAAGLQKRFDFEIVHPGNSSMSRHRADVVVKLPGGGVLAIDAKASLNGYLEAQDATAPSVAVAALTRHAASLRGDILRLANLKKSSNSTDLFALFLPGDGFLLAALRADTELADEIQHSGVLVVTPSTLLLLSRAIAYGWWEESRGLHGSRANWPELLFAQWFGLGTFLEQTHSNDLVLTANLSGLQK